jgi:hypothetical protein
MCTRPGIKRGCCVYHYVIKSSIIDIVISESGNFRCFTDDLPGSEQFHAFTNIIIKTFIHVIVLIADYYLNCHDIFFYAARRGALVARLLFEIFIAKALYHCEIIMADDIVLFAVIHSHEGSIQAISAGLRIFSKGIRAQLDFWLGNWNNTIGYPEISDLNRRLCRESRSVAESSRANETSARPSRGENE